MKEHYFYKESAELVDTIDEIARKHSGRERVFDDFLTITVCCLAGGTREEEYLQTIAPYCTGEKGKRDVDKLVLLLGRLVSVMDDTRADILGDIFQGAITRGQNGQFFTPDSLCELMARLTAADEHREETATEVAPNEPETSWPLRKTIADQCCGSGRTLLAAAKEHPHAYFVGQDIDHRCAKITAINLALWNLYGKVIWGNSLTLECKRVYHTGFNGRGVISVEEHSEKPAHDAIIPSTLAEASTAEDDQATPLHQGSLFDDPPSTVS